MKLSKHFDTNTDLMLRCPCCRRADFDEEFIEKMERLRVITAQPMVVVSGFRCDKYNAKAGGSPGSEHTLGLAMDIKVWDSTHRHRLLKYSFQPQLDITRHGIENTTMHIGMGNSDTGHPLEKLWHYYKKYRRK
jgi:hypothetical protein